MSPTEQRRMSLAAANAQRRRIAGVRRELLAGRLTLADVMDAPPVELEGVMLIDVLRMSRSSVSARQAAPSLTRLGKLAVADNVNLLVPLGSASSCSRAWLAEHGSFWARPRNRVAA